MNIFFMGTGSQGVKKLAELVTKAVFASNRSKTNLKLYSTCYARYSSAASNQPVYSEVVVSEGEIIEPWSRPADVFVVLSKPGPFAKHVRSRLTPETVIIHQTDMPDDEIVGYRGHEICPGDNLPLNMVMLGALSVIIKRKFPYFSQKQILDAVRTAFGEKNFTANKKACEYGRKFMK